MQPLTNLSLSSPTHINPSQLLVTIILHSTFMRSAFFGSNIWARTCVTCQGLPYFSYFNGLQFHPCCCKWKDFYSLLWLNGIPLSIHTTFSLPFVCWRTQRLARYSSYCEQCCNKHGVAGLPLIYWFPFIWRNTQEWDFWIVW